MDDMGNRRITKETVCVWFLFDLSYKSYVQMQYYSKSIFCNCIKQLMDLDIQTA